jgi:flagellar biosynthesis/type III secretory pathway protein FliH
MPRRREAGERKERMNKRREEVKKEGRREGKKERWKEGRKEGRTMIHVAILDRNDDGMKEVS